MRSIAICKELTQRHGLYLSSGKENVKRHRLREPDNTKYKIYDSLVKNVPKSKSWDELQQRLRGEGIQISFKTKGSTSQVEGVRFTMNNLSFNGSKVDKMFSYLKIDFALKQNLRAEQAQQQSAPKQDFNLITTVGSDDLFAPNPAFDPEEEEFRRQMQRRKKKKNHGLKL